MQKETLTVEEIRYDLRGQIRSYMICVGLGLGLFLFFGFTAVVTVNASDWYKPFFVTLLVLFFGGVSLAFLVGSIVEIMVIHNLYTLCKRPGSIVKDRLVGKEVKSHLYRWRYYETCHLRFASYGEYAIPWMSHEWSDLYYMDSSTVYMHAGCDDEFYLVLSKPHTGKILLAYNAKMFEYQPPQP